MKRPSFQFYPSDWLEDIGLRRAGLAARGLWADMLCFMHQGEPYGHLRKAGDDINTAELARMVGEPARTVALLLAELGRRGVFSRTETGTIYSRRMVRDEGVRDVRAAGGGKGGSAAFKNPRASRPGDARQGGRQGGSAGSPFDAAEGGSPGTPPSSTSSSSPSRTGREAGTREELRTAQAACSEELLTASAALRTPPDVVLAKFSRTPGGQVITNIAACARVPWLVTTTNRMRGARLAAAGEVAHGPAVSPENRERLSGIAEWYEDRQKTKDAR